MGRVKKVALGVANDSDLGAGRTRACFELDGSWIEGIGGCCNQRLRFESGSHPVGYRSSRKMFVMMVAVLGRSARLAVGGLMLSDELMVPPATVTHERRFTSSAPAALLGNGLMATEHVSPQR